MPEDYRERVPSARQRVHLDLIMEMPGYPQKNFLRHPVVFRNVEVGMLRHRLFTFQLNHPRSLAYVAAAIASVGGSIQTAELFPRGDGTVLIEVEFSLADSKRLQDLESVLVEYFDLSGRTRPTPPCEEVGLLTLAFGYSEDGQRGVLSVEGEDRRGLLYRIANTLAAYGIKISRAEIETRGSKICDRFFVTDRFGKVMDIQSDLARIERDIRA